MYMLLSIQYIVYPSQIMSFVRFMLTKLCPFSLWMQITLEVIIVGVTLCATEMDGDDKMFSLAFDLASIENNHNWTGFDNILFKAIK